jgi:hypothetical protein
MNRPHVLLLAATCLSLLGVFEMTAATPRASIEIVAGGAGALGRGTVGIDWIAKDGKSARISIGGRAAGIAWATRLDVHRQSIVRLNSDVFRVQAIVPPAGGHRGQLIFAPEPTRDAAALPADAIVLTGSDVLRLGGPEIQEMTALRITAFAPDDRAPASATVEWWPGALERADAAPASVRRAELRAGAQAVVGGTSLQALAVEGETAEHPAGLVLAVIAGRTEKP